MKKISMTMVLIALAAAVASAQMMGGGRMPGHTPGTVPTPGSGFGSLMPRSGGGNLMGDLIGSRGAMGSGHLIVTPQGNVIVSRAVDSNADGIYEGELVALTPAGTEAWKKGFAGFGFLLGVSNDLLLAVEPRTRLDWTSPFATTLVAIDLSDGSEAWRRDIDGVPMSAEPFSGGTYLTVVDRAASAAPVPGTRTTPMTAALWMIDRGGNVLWKYDLAR